MPLSKISLPQPRPLKMAGFSTFFNKFSLQHLLNHKLHGLVFEDCLKIPKLLPGSQSETFVTILKLIRCLLFSAIKNWGISKSEPARLYLKKWKLAYGKSFQV